MDADGQVETVLVPLARYSNLQIAAELERRAADADVDEFLEEAIAKVDGGYKAEEDKSPDEWRESIRTERRKLRHAAKAPVAAAGARADQEQRDQSRVDQAKSNVTAFRRPKPKG